MTHTPTRVSARGFHKEAFTGTIIALVVAPFLAAANEFHSYTPFILLRFWMLGFCWYNYQLARQAGGLRRIWQPIYALIALPFMLVWGLKIEAWALIDITAATLIGISAPFLRTQPEPLPVQTEPLPKKATHARRRTAPRQQ